MADNLKVVSDLSGDNPAGLSAEEESLLEQLQKKRAEAIKHSKAVNSRRIDEIRFEAFTLDQQLKPLYQRRQELAKEHGRLSGVSKIILTDDEKKKYASRQVKRAAK